MRAQLPDFDVFVATILAAVEPAATLMNDVNADTWAEDPAVMFTVFNNGQRELGVWSLTLQLTTVCAPADSHRVCSRLYELVHSWNTPGKGVVGTVGVHSVEDVNVFNRIHDITLVHGKELVQYAAAFNLIVQDWG